MQNRAHIRINVRNVGIRILKMQCHKSSEPSNLNSLNIKKNLFCSGLNVCVCNRSFRRHVVHNVKCSRVEGSQVDSLCTNNRARNWTFEIGAAP